MAVRPNDLVVGLLALVGFACSHAVNASAALLNPLDAEVVAKARPDWECDRHVHERMNAYVCM